MPKKLKLANLYFVPEARVLLVGGIKIIPAHIKLEYVDSRGRTCAMLLDLPESQVRDIGNLPE